jgi:hypothetical protein
MENLTAVLNLAARPRWVSRDGVLYLISPVTMISPGVMNGSQGSILYELVDLRHSYSAWNGIPILLGHPDRSGMDPQVFAQTGLGWVRNAAVTDKLIAEAWFDVERVKRIHNELINLIQAGKPVEVSTGLKVSVEYAHGTDDRGRIYDRVARNHQPDHLAVLVGQTGACSIHDGCGVNNKRNDTVCTCNNSVVADQSDLLGLPVLNFENPVAANEINHSNSSDDLLGLPTYNFENPLTVPKNIGRSSGSRPAIDPDRIEGPQPWLF